MRASEFVFKEANNSLGDALRAMAQQQQAAKPGQKNLNATQGSVGTQGTQSSVAPQQATSGGTQTQQNGVAQAPSGPAGQQKPGVMGSFISGLTGGKASSLSSVAKLGAAKVAGGAGLNSVSNDLQQNVADKEYEKVGGQTQQSNIFAKPADVGAAFKQGQVLKLPNVGDIKVGRVGPQGIELDTSKAPSIGVPKLTINPKDLLRK
jgi:hypothetical protein